MSVPPDWLVPPPGYKPGQTKAPLILNIAIPVGAIAVFLACLRFYVRTCLLRVVGKDDWLLVAAVVFFSVICAAVVWSTMLGMGRHEYDLIREHNDPSTRVSVR